MMSRLSYLTGLAHKADSDRGHRAILPVTSAISRLAEAPVTVLRTAVDGVVRWHERRSTIKVLSDLDDRLLRDIGLLRGDIGFVVDELIDQSRAKRNAVNETHGRLQSVRSGTPIPMGCG
ncbi:DUF1127 domain-containing protein [Rhodospirillaceae bacterium SYSU D60014]|uniref:DUF1127 domain-containing protein n=1 Tax=Virgifigura deserti TaxID=2268457 RepID=UPI000E66B59D